MAKRLSIKHKKMRKDKDTVYKKGEAPQRHKIAHERAKKALFKKNNRMT